MRQKIKSLKHLMPKKIQTRRYAYFGMALIILFSVLSYSLFFHTSKVKAASTIGTSTSSPPTGYSAERRTVVSSKGVIVAVYDAGSQSPGGLVFATSSDNAATWSSATQIDNYTTATNDFSVAIDGDNNIFIVYTVSDSTTSSLYNIELVANSSGWTVGSRSTIASGGICQGNGGSDGVYYLHPSIGLKNPGSVQTTYLVNFESITQTDTGFGCTASGIIYTYSSTNFTSWSSAALKSAPTGYDYTPLVCAGGNCWLLSSMQSELYLLSSTNTWIDTNLSLGVDTRDVSYSYGLDKLHFFYKNSSNNLVYRSYDFATGVLSSEVIISSATSDVAGTIVTDSLNIWAIYLSYVGSSSYNVVYKMFNGTSWDSSSTALTTDNANNGFISAPQRVGNTTNVPIMWSVSGSPNTVKAVSFQSSVGSVTDTGNQTGSYSGSLTGSSGDTIVKCGTWYYNTVNIVSGMTVKVCSSNGSSGGSLIIYANSVTVAGSIDGSYRGMPGGVSLKSIAGQGGGTNFSSGGAGAAGTPGSSFSGQKGSGNFTANGGTAGTNGATGGSGGSGEAAGANSSSGGGGGGGGTGSTTTAGTAGTLAGYLGTGINGDTSTDESGTLGSGAGAGGSGGSGAGGGSGGAGTVSTNITIAPGGAWNGGAGGAGGNGAAGGIGGKGGNGGAIIKIYSNGSLSVAGSITATGQTGISGGSPSAAGAGTIGDPGYYCTVGC